MTRDVTPDKPAEQISRAHDALRRTMLNPNAAPLVRLEAAEAELETRGPYQREAQGVLIDALSAPDTTVRVAALEIIAADWRLSRCR